MEMGSLKKKINFTIDFFSIFFFLQAYQCDCVYWSFTLFRDRMECERSGNGMLV